MTIIVNFRLIPDILFSEPDFISAYEIGEFVYFFFREVAVEFINCGKVSKDILLHFIIFII